MKPQIKTIEGREYRLYAFGFDEWGRLTAELASVSGPAAGVLAALQSTGVADVGGALRELAVGLLGALDSGILDRLCGGLSWNAGADGRDEWRPLNRAKARDAVWAGRYFEGVRVLVWVLEVAFRPFWTAVIESVPELSELLSGVVIGQESTSESAAHE